jgi:hypothetical protein
MRSSAVWSARSTALDAQREACEAYIKSQAHEGWRAIPGRYDEEAFSGASFDRPALQQLLADIRTGTIDIVLVYKVDRLTRYAGEIELHLPGEKVGGIPTMAHTGDIALMAHLMRRAGFGAGRDELEARVTKGYDATVEELLHPETLVSTPPSKAIS